MIQTHFSKPKNRNRPLWPQEKIDRVQHEMELRKKWATSFERLSDRQIEILREVSRGLTTPEIAEMFYISPHTVRTHRQNIRRLLGFASRCDSLWFALAFDLIVAPKTQS